MNVEYLLLGVILATALYFFWTQKLRSDVVALLVVLSLVFPWPHPDGKWRGILTYQEGFSGFGSVAVVMVTAMFVVGAAMVRTGAAEFVGGKLFRACAKHELLFQIAILVITTVFSMFINDTTVVLIFLPVIMAICRERNLSPSRYLLCAAYGSLLGGQWTLIGTRSNILISDYIRQKTGTGFGFFDLTPVAAVVFVAASLYFVLFGRRRLPQAAEAGAADEELAREYLTEVMVTPESTTVGKTLDQLEWSRRADLTVVEVIRGKDRIPAAGWVRLQPGDVLIMQGAVPTIGQLLQSSDFKLQEELRINDKTLRSVDLVTVEGLLSPSSNYIGNTLQQVDFGRDYGFTVLGISRHGTTIRDRPMATPLQYGDSLLLLGHKSSLDRLERNENLLLLAHRHFPALGKRKAFTLLFIMLGVVVTAVSGLLNPAVSIPLAAMLTILLGCLPIRDAYSSVDWQAVVTVAGMIPFGHALEETGAAADVASVVVHWMSAFGPHAVLGVLLLLAICLTQLIENAAVAVVLAPLAYQVAMETGADPMPFMVGLAVCISSAFCTPVAHESTILVMGPGRYRFKHYLQVGGAMAFLTWLISTLLAPKFWSFAPPTLINP